MHSIQKQLNITTAPGLTPYASIGLRYNPKRAHVLVSPLLGKHIPVKGEETWEACQALAVSILSVSPVHLTPKLTMGYAETATGIAANLSLLIGSDYFQSTRINVPGHTSELSFEESHSHAAEHAIYLNDANRKALYSEETDIILVDDEISTGNTLINTIRAIEAKHHHNQYHIATLVDARTTAAKAKMTSLEHEIGAKIYTHALHQSEIHTSDTTLDTAQGLVARYPRPPQKSILGEVAGTLTRQKIGLNTDLTLGAPNIRLHEMFFAAADLFSEQEIREMGRAHIIAIEEDMFFPSMLSFVTGITFSSFTRSPIVAIPEDPDYPIQRATQVTKTSGELRWAYNLPEVDTYILCLPSEHAYSLADRENLISLLLTMCSHLIVLV